MPSKNPSTDSVLWASTVFTVLIATMVRWGVTVGFPFTILIAKTMRWGVTMGFPVYHSYSYNGVLGGYCIYHSYSYNDGLEPLHFYGWILADPDQNPYPIWGSVDPVLGPDQSNNIDKYILVVNVI